LESWKQIAAYLGKSERTVRRWQQTEGLPVHRHVHQQKGSVWSYRSELDQWLENRREAPVLEPKSAPKVANNGRKWGLFALVFGVVLASWAVVRRQSAEFPALNPEPLALLPGAAYGADFSPDGKRIVFYWGHSVGDSHGLHLKSLDNDSVVPLAISIMPTNMVASYRYSPAWSPDGATIAYLRRLGVSSSSELITDLCLVSPDGGPENCPVRLASGVRFWGHSRHLAWTRDSQWIVAPMSTGTHRGIYAISLRTGEKRLMSGESEDLQAPALSANGQSLLYIKQSGVGVAGLQEVVRQDLTSDLRPSGTPRVVFTARSNIKGLAWTPDGQEVVLCSSVSGFPGDKDYRMFRLRAEPDASRRMILPDVCSAVGMSGGGLLTYATGAKESSRLLQAALRSSEQAIPFVHSGQHDNLPNYSPDGKLVAFISNRSGGSEIWIAGKDGANPRKVTIGSHVVHSNPPQWSPDGTQLVYASIGQDAKLELNRIALVGGGRPVRIPVPHKDAVNPAWSDDGQWIFYWAGNCFWKVRVDGKDCQEILRFDPSEHVSRAAARGKFLYFTHLRGRYSLLRLHMETKKVEQLAEGLVFPHFSITPRNVYLTRMNERLTMEAIPLEASGGTVRTAGVLPQLSGIRQAIDGLAVSPDETELVFAVSGEQVLEMQVVRHFR